MNEMCTRETAKYCVLDMRTGGESCLTSWSRYFQQFMEPQLFISIFTRTHHSPYPKPAIPNLRREAFQNIVSFFQFMCIIISNGY